MALSNQIFRSNGKNQLINPVLETSGAVISSPTYLCITLMLPTM